MHVQTESTKENDVLTRLPETFYKKYNANTTGAASSALSLAFLRNVRMP